MKTSAATAAPPTQEDAPAAIRAAAMAAHARAEYDAALEHWSELRASPEVGAPDYLGAIWSAKAAERVALVAELVSEGQKCFPREAAAMRRHGDAPAWEARDETWHKLVRSPPGDRQAALEAALAPLKQPDLPRRPLETVLARLDFIKTRFPRFSKPYAEELVLLRKAGQYDRALALAIAHRALFPKNEKLALAHVSILDALTRFEEAYELIAEVRKMLPPSADIEAAYVHALSQLGRLDEAEAHGARAVANFADSADLAREYAAIASRNADWPEAYKRLVEADAKFPGNAKIKKRLSALRQQMPDLEVAPSQQEQDERAALFARFESLGGSAAGCEFGVVQRVFGSVALGLLRWTAITLESLATGIGNGFDGLTEPGNVRLKTYRSSGDREEYMVEDDKYGFNSHTFIEVQDAPADKLLVQTIRRLGFLRTKLIEDLRIGGKVFVYKCTVPTSEEAIRAVHAAIRAQGPGAFLCVLRADAANPKGTIRQLDDGLFLGYAQYFMWEVTPPGTPSIDRATWREICAQVAACLDALPGDQRLDSSGRLGEQCLPPPDPPSSFRIRADKVTGA